MDKQQLAKSLRELADWIEKDSVQIKDVKINTQSGHVEGVDQTYTRTTYHPNGERYLHLDLHLYDGELDESDEAFDPWDKIRKDIKGL